MIKKLASLLIKKHSTNDPFELAERMNIVVRSKFLTSTNGYHVYLKRLHIITLNNSLSEEQQKVVLAHELGHALLHKGLSMSFFEVNTYYSVDKYERQANIFAAELLLSDQIVKSYEGLNLEQIARAEHVPVELVNFKQIERK